MSRSADRRSRGTAHTSQYSLILLDIMPRVTVAPTGNSVEALEQDQYLRPRPRRRWRVGRGDAVAVGMYLCIAVIPYWDVWTASTPSVVEPGGLDSQMNMWFLSWTPFAVLHGHNPLFTTYGNYPYGVNLLTNTSETLLGLVAAPVTVIFGPIVSFNVMLILAMASSATAGYVLARRFTTWRPSAFFAGLLYGFSPYMVGQGVNHLNLLFVPLPPLMFLVLYELLVVQRKRPQVWGALLALLACTQFFISSEVLAESAVIATIALVVLVVLHPGAVRARAKHAVVGLAVAMTISGVVLVGPVLYALHGPGHVVGPMNPFPLQANRADLLGAVVPNLNQHFAPSSLVTIGNQFAANIPENGSYLGLPLLVALAVFTVVLRRKAIVTFSAAMAAVAYVLSLGARLIVSGSPSIPGAPYAAAGTGIRLPGAIFDHIPILDNGEPARLSLFVALFASLILAIGLDHLKHRAMGSTTWSSSRSQSRHPAPRTLPPAGAKALAAAVGVGVLLPLVPSWPYPVGAVDTPAYFTTNAVEAVPAGSVALLYPYPSPNVDSALPVLWQVTSKMRFKTPGGYFLVPQAGTGRATFGRVTLIGTTLDELYSGAKVAPSPSLRAELWNELDSWKVETVIAAPVGADPKAAMSFLTWLIGRRPVSSGGVEVWYHIGSRGG